MLLFLFLYSERIKHCKYLMKRKRLEIRSVWQMGEEKEVRIKNDKHWRHIICLELVLGREARTMKTPCHTREPPAS